MKLLSLIVSLSALTITGPLAAQEAEKPKMLSPGQIVDQAPAEEWQAIAASDLLIMKLQPDAKGKERQVIIQLMPPPFSQGWIRNIRKLAKANWWDDTRIVRVQDNYVVQWGDPAQEESDRKPLPDGLEVMTEEDYIVDGDTLSEFTGNNQFENYDQVDEQLLVLGDQAANSSLTEQQLFEVLKEMTELVDSMEFDKPTEQERIALLSINSTQTELTSQGWHERDGYASWVEFWKGWPLANFIQSTWEDENGKQIPRPANTQRHVLAQQNILENVEKNEFWPTHCYGAVGVGRGLSPDTGSGAELYTVIGHAPRHLDRNIAVVGRIIEGMHHLSSLPRGFGPLGFYETPEEQVPIQSIRLASDLPTAEQPRFEFLSTEGESFAQYVNRRANREPPFFIKPAGGADICNIPVPVRRVKEN